MFFHRGLGLGGQPRASPHDGQHASLGKAFAAENRGRHEHLQQQEERRKDQERHELVLKVHKAHGGHAGGGQLVFELNQGGEVHKPGPCPGVGALSGLGGFDQGGLVQLGHHGVALPVRPEPGWIASGVKGRDGGPFQGGQAQKVHVSALLGDFSGGRDDIVLVVFTVRQHHHGAGRFGVLVEACPAGANGRADGGALGGDHARTHRGQEELDGGHVGGQGALDVGFSSEDDQTNAVASGLGHQALHGAGGQVEPWHAHILSHHAVADVERHHHVDAFRLHLFQPASHFGVQPTHHQGRQRPAPKQELPSLTEHPIRREHRFQAGRI